MVERLQRGGVRALAVLLLLALASDVVLAGRGGLDEVSARWRTRPPPTCWLAISGR